jgi:hypothetical protein
LSPPSVSFPVFCFALHVLVLTCHTCLGVGCTHAAIIKEHLKNKVAAVNSEREASNPRKVVPRHLQPKPAKEPKPQSAKPGSAGSGGNHNAKKSNIGKNKAGRGGKGRK